MRLIGSILWDELSAMLCTQSHLLIDLWPLAIGWPSSIYHGMHLGPVTKFPSKEVKHFWRLANYIVPILVTQIAVAAARQAREGSES